MTRWFPLVVWYNAALAVLCGIILAMAYSGRLYGEPGEYGGAQLAPEASAGSVAASTAVLLIVLNGCFLVFGPGLEWVVTKLRGKAMHMHVALFCVGLPIAVIIAWVYMQLVVTPF